MRGMVRGWVAAEGGKVAGSEHDRVKGGRRPGCTLLWRGYSVPMADNTTIQVSRQARDHLAQVAKERGMTLGQLVEQLASEQPTAAQLAERVAADRQVVRDVIGVDISDEEFEKAPDVLGNIYKIAAEKARAARGAAA